MKIVKCGMKECNVRLSSGSIQGKQYCTKEHRIINEMRESQAELKRSTQDAVDYQQRLLTLNSKLDAEIAELINLSKPFARFHCQNKECKCHNCLLHRYITTLEKDDE